MAYERFSRTQYSGFGEPILTARLSDHRLRFNSHALRIFAAKGITNVRILWDPLRTKIAFKPSSPREEHSYKLSTNKKATAVDISGSAYFNYVGWSSSETFHIPLVWN